MHESGSWGTVGVLLLLGLAFVTVALAANRLLRPVRVSDAGRSSYECGLDPVGSGWGQSQIRYYGYAFVYVIFAVEAIYLFPWATIFARAGFGAAAAVEMGIFVALLALGILYAWRKQMLTWV